MRLFRLCLYVAAEQLLASRMVSLRLFEIYELFPGIGAPTGRRR